MLGIGAAALAGAGSATADAGDGGSSSSTSNESSARSSSSTNDSQPDTGTDDKPSADRGKDDDSEGRESDRIGSDAADERGAPARGSAPQRPADAENKGEGSGDHEDADDEDSGDGILSDANSKPDNGFSGPSAARGEPAPGPESIVQDADLGVEDAPVVTAARLQLSVEEITPVEPQRSALMTADPIDPAVMDDPELDTLESPAALTGTSAMAAALPTSDAAATSVSPAVLDEIWFGDGIDGWLGMAMDASGRYVFVGNNHWRDNPSHGVAIIDTVLKRVIADIPLTNSNVHGLAVLPDGSRVYVGSFDGRVSGVVYVDVATGTVGSIPLGSRVQLIAISPDGKTLYAPTSTGDGVGGVALIDTETNTVKSTVPIPDGYSTGGIAVTPDGKTVFLTGYASGSATLTRRNWALDLESMTIQQVTDQQVTAAYAGLSWMNRTAKTADGKIEYDVVHAATGLIIRKIDTRTGAVLASSAITGTYTGGAMMLSPDGKHAYVISNSGAGVGAILSIIDVSKIGEPVRTNPIEEILNAVSFTNEVTKWLDNLSKVWNLGEVLSGAEFVAGIWQFADGIRELDLLKTVGAIPAIVSPLLKGPPAILLEAGKLVISIVLPLNAEESEKFFEFRMRCMFNKDSGSLSSAEAQRVVDRYTGWGSAVTIPADYARYNVGGWFGRPSC